MPVTWCPLSFTPSFSSFSPSLTHTIHRKEGQAVVMLDTFSHVLFTFTRKHKGVIWPLSLHPVTLLTQPLPQKSAWNGIQRAWHPNDMAIGTMNCQQWHSQWPIRSPSYTTCQAQKMLTHNGTPTDDTRKTFYADLALTLCPLWTKILLGALRVQLTILSIPAVNLYLTDVVALDNFQKQGWQSLG